MNKRVLVALFFLFSLPILVGKARQQSVYTNEVNESLLTGSPHYGDLEMEDEFESEMIVRCFTYIPDDTE
jgi:hypothetical protein